MSNLNGELKEMPGALWAISRKVNGAMNSVALIQDMPASDEEIRLAMEWTYLRSSEVDKYFPKNPKGERCPTFELMALFHELPRATNGQSP